MDTEVQVIADLKRRGLGDALRLLLDIIEPLGILGAQVLWIAQPTASLIGGRDVIAGLAQALEQPGGIDRLRALLDEDV